MNAIYAFGLLILLAFLGSRFIVRRRSLSPLNYIFLSGLVYIFLGMYLGKMGLNILSTQVLDDLTPLLSLGLGWIGFLFGFQFEGKYLRCFSKNIKKLSFFLSAFVFFPVYTAVFFLVRELYVEQPPFLLYGMALSFGLLATVNSPTLLNAASFALPSKGDYSYLARFLTSVSGFWAIVGLALLFSFLHFPFFESRIILNGAYLLVLATGIPILLAYLFYLLTKKRTSEQDILVYLLGFVFFVSGAAFYFNLPPLYVSMVMGITYSNLTKIQERLYPLLLSAENHDGFFSCLSQFFPPWYSGLNGGQRIVLGSTSLRCATIVPNITSFPRTSSLPLLGSARPRKTTAGSVGHLSGEASQGAAPHFRCDPRPRQEGTLQSVSGNLKKVLPS